MARSDREVLQAGRNRGADASGWVWKKATCSVLCRQAEGGGGCDGQLAPENRPRTRPDRRQVFKFAWVVDFPLLGWDEEAKRYVAEHHPFTRPNDEDLPLFDSDPGEIRAQAYDLVLNGYEVGGGSMRIYRRDVQEKMFKALGFTPEEAREKFGFLLDAFEYGTPPHGGIAFGLDRLVMLLAGRTNLRETIAFPKTASATDLLMRCAVRRRLIASWKNCTSASCRPKAAADVGATHSRRLPLPPSSGGCGRSSR